LRTSPSPTRLTRRPRRGAVSIWSWALMGSTPLCGATSLAMRVRAHSFFRVCNSGCEPLLLHACSCVGSARRGRSVRAGCGSAGRSASAALRDHPPLRTLGLRTAVRVQRSAVRIACCCLSHHAVLCDRFAYIPLNKELVFWYITASDEAGESPWLDAEHSLACSPRFVYHARRGSC
jgi:hypothetical protein